MCLAQFVGWSGGRKRVRQNSVSKQQPGGFECAVNVAGKLVVAVVSAAHGFSAASGNKRPILKRDRKWLGASLPVYRVCPRQE